MDLQELVHTATVVLPNNGAHDRFFYVHVSDAKMLLTKIEQLQAVIDRLPQTADGVPITPGARLFRPVKNPSCGHIEIRELPPVHAVEETHVRSYGLNGFCNVSTELYSTRDAAAEAKEE